MLGSLTGLGFASELDLKNLGAVDTKRVGNVADNDSSTRVHPTDCTNPIPSTAVKRRLDS